jgi:hypothetical protein
MNRRLPSFVSLFLILCSLSAFAPSQVRLLGAQAQSSSPATLGASQEGPAGVEPSIAQALPPTRDSERGRT